MRAWGEFPLLPHFILQFGCLLSQMYKKEMSVWRVQLQTTPDVAYPCLHHYASEDRRNRTEKMHSQTEGRDPSAPEADEHARKYKTVSCKELAFFSSLFPPKWAQSPWHSFQMEWKHVSVELSGPPRLWCLPSRYLVANLARWIKSFHKPYPLPPCFFTLSPLLSSAAKIAISSSVISL